MSCNGCRVLRKGCSDSCILRPCLQWIEGAEAQGHATVFVAKFFGRAGLMNFISAVPDNQRPAVFQSLLYEACGRTVNPVFGAVGLLWSGSWQVCQAAVETVLKGGSLQPIVAPLKPAANVTATTAPPPSAATNLFHHHFYAPPPAATTTPLQSRSPNSVLVEAMNSSHNQHHQGNPRFPWQHRPGKLLRDLEQQQQQQQGVKREFEVLAPVPRRVRPRLVPEEDAPQTLDLDLTLGSSTPKQQENEEEQQRILALDSGSSKRVHSPCLSITSEGSITSVDTTDLKISLRHERSSSA